MADARCNFIIATEEEWQQLLKIIDFKELKAVIDIVFIGAGDYVYRNLKTEETYNFGNFDRVVEFIDHYINKPPQE